MTDREKREQELNQILQSENGRDRITDIYRRHFVPEGQIDPTGIPLSQMIEEILEEEFGSEET